MKLNNKNLGNCACPSWSRQNLYGWRISWVKIPRLSNFKTLKIIIRPAVNNVWSFDVGRNSWTWLKWIWTMDIFTREIDSVFGRSFWGRVRHTYGETMFRTFGGGKTWIFGKNWWRMIDRTKQSVRTYERSTNNNIFPLVNTAPTRSPYGTIRNICRLKTNGVCCLFPTGW